MPHLRLRQTSIEKFRHFAPVLLGALACELLISLIFVRRAFASTSDRSDRVRRPCPPDRFAIVLIELVPAHRHRFVCIHSPLPDLLYLPHGHIIRCWVPELKRSEQFHRDGWSCSVSNNNPQVSFVSVSNHNTKSSVSALVVIFAPIRLRWPLQTFRNLSLRMTAAHGRSQDDTEMGSLHH